MTGSGQREVQEGDDGAGYRGPFNIVLQLPPDLTSLAGGQSGNFGSCPGRPIPLAREGLALHTIWEHAGMDGEWWMYDVWRVGDVQTG